MSNAVNSSLWVPFAAQTTVQKERPCLVPFWPEARQGRTLWAGGYCDDFGGAASLGVVR